MKRVLRFRVLLVGIMLEHLPLLKHLPLLMKERNVRLRLNQRLRLKLILGFCTLAITDILDIMVMDTDLDTDGVDTTDSDITVMVDAAITLVLLFLVLLENRSFPKEIKSSF